VTVSARPECWTISSASAGPNAVRGRIGASVYLGENAQYDFVSGDTTLKILELNPRFTERSGAGEFFAGIQPEDVVVLGD
jgi:iron(III) transport system ATP-binding protein